MKVVALISGGKDSCFNVVQCVANGHDIVALANLHPPPGAGDELDSFMYQTVGHDVIQHYAECFVNPNDGGADPMLAPSLPLFRRAITGSSRNIDMTYDPGNAAPIPEGAADEVEDLYLLLQDVLAAIPGVQAVSVGAILSNYQRVRVENVCQRLGLTSLSFLWERDQVGLLKEMVDVGMHSILVKVAAMGLDQRHLGKSLAQMQPQLLKMVQYFPLFLGCTNLFTKPSICSQHQEYDLHPCGEGGEYETVTLDCPVFRRRLVVKATQIVVHSDDAIAPVAYLRLTEIVVEDKPATDIMSYSQLQSVLRARLNAPAPLAWPSTSLFDLAETAQAPNIDEGEDTVAMTGNPIVKSVGHLLAISAIRPRKREHVQSPGLEEDARDVMEQVREHLRARNLDFSHVVMATVLVKSMADFARANKVYGSVYGVNPAARACVESALPCQIQVDIIAMAKPTFRKDNLHVQSISHWAPANIGPYSQCCIADDRVFVAGQIGLIPNTMAFPTAPVLANGAIDDASFLAKEYAQFKEQSRQSLRHFARICRAVKVRDSDVAGCVAYVNDMRWARYVRHWWRQIMSREGIAAELAELDDDLTLHESVESEGTHCPPPLAIVQVPMLPRGALIEWVGTAFRRDGSRARYALSRSRAPLDSDDESDEPIVARLAARRDRPAADLVVPVFPNACASVTSAQRGSLTITSASFALPEELPSSVKVKHAYAFVTSAIKALARDMNEWIHPVDVLTARVFYNSDLTLAFEDVFSTAWTRSPFAESAISFVPCVALESNAHFIIYCM